MRAFFLAGIFLLVVSYINCSGNLNFTETQGTVIAGNPMNSNLSSFKVLQALCAKISSCNTQVTMESCQTGVFQTGGIDYQLGLPANTYSAYSSIVQAESSGVISSDPTFTQSCVTAIDSLSCSSTQVQGSYNPALSNPYSGVANMFPNQAQTCPDVYPINLIQSNYRWDQGTTAAAVSVPFPQTQLAGDLNLIVILSQDTISNLNSVTDSAGNSYTLVSGPVRDSISTQWIYMSSDILASSGTNIVTANFAAAAPAPYVKIYEYSGIDPVNPLNTFVQATGTGTAIDSGVINSTGPRNLIVGIIVAQHTISATSPGYQVRDNWVGDVLEDKLVLAPGSYSATATQLYSGPWIVNLLSFNGR